MTKKEIITLVGILLFTLGAYVILPRNSIRVETFPFTDNAATSTVIRKDNAETNSPFWATTYRYYPEEAKIYFVADRPLEGSLAGHIIAREVAGADPSTFEILGGADREAIGIAKDKNGVYCNDKLRPDIDAFSIDMLFQPGSRTVTYFKDKNNVYFKCTAIEGADTLTFRKLEEGPTWNRHTWNNQYLNYGMDKKYVYFNGKVIAGAVPASFRLLEENYAFDSRTLFKSGARIGDVFYAIPADISGKIISYGPVGAVLLSEDDNLYVLDKMRLVEAEGLNFYKIYQGKIYYLDTKFRLIQFDIFKNEPHYIDLGNLPLSDSAPRLYGPSELPRINDFFIRDNFIYFLYGDFCNGYLNRCDVSLMRHNMNTGETNSLLSNLEARDIMGLDKDSQNIFLRHSEGDGGCGWQSLFKVNLTDKSLKKENFAMCGDDSEDKIEQYQSAIKNFYRDMVDKTVMTDGIYLKNGRIILPADEIDTGRNEAQYINY